MTKAIIVDDEPYSCETLATLLEKYCPEIKVADICYSADSAITSIKDLRPNIVFLDIEMPNMNGFELLESLDEINFHIVFTTSYDQYAIRAIRFSALDYLLKPVDREELQQAVRRALHTPTQPVQQQLQLLFQKLSHTSNPIQKIALPTLDGLQLITVNTIISCTAESNYTIFYMKNKQKIVVSKTLKDMEDLLTEHAFCRVHHSHLVNLNEIDKYIKGDGSYLVMSDGSNIDVSRSKKDLLMQRLQPGK